MELPNKIIKEETTIIPAYPGINAIYRHDNVKTFDVGSPIIAWRIITFTRKSGRQRSVPEPIENYGDCMNVENFVGLQYPCGRICLADGEEFENIDKLIEGYEWVTGDD